MRMTTYFMFGKYSLEALKTLSSERTQKAIAVIEANGGTFKSAHMLLGETDVVAIVDLPDTERAMKTSVELSKLLGVSFNTVPALTVEAFDQLMG
jgi:uncharacterized protein with GYD domain